MSLRLEEAQALGFESVEQCAEHQVWIQAQKNERLKVRAAIETAE